MGNVRNEGVYPEKTPAKDAGDSIRAYRWVGGIC